MTRPVPVLMYHHINPHKGDMVTVTPKVFDEQMKHLKMRGYRTLTLTELEAYIKGDLTLNEKAVAVTFDDGWLDNYIYAFPVLKKFKINAAVFIITDRTEDASKDRVDINTEIPTHNESKKLISGGESSKVVLDWNLIKEMRESGLLEFYPHTKSHRRCSELPEDELMDELSASRAAMESRLDKECPYFCWPYGDYDDASLALVKKAGYSAVFTTDHGVVRPGSDPHSIKRIDVRDNVSWFKKRIFTYTSPIFSELYLKIRKR